MKTGTHSNSLLYCREAIDWYPTLQSRAEGRMPTGTHSHYLLYYRAGVDLHPALYKKNMALKFWVSCAFLMEEEPLNSFWVISWAQGLAQPVRYKGARRRLPQSLGKKWAFSIVQSPSFMGDISALTVWVPSSLSRTGTFCWDVFP